MRLRFARTAAAANMSHLEQIKTLRNLAASSGLDCWPAKPGGGPAPKMAFGPSLPAGCESLCEYADLYLAQRCAEDVVKARLSAAGAGCFSLLSVKRVPVHFPSIEASVNAVRYFLEADAGGLSRGVLDAFFTLENAPYEKPGPSGEAETVNARPLILGAEPDPAGGIRLVLRFEPGRNIKPADALRVIAGRAVEIGRTVREELYWRNSGGGLEII
jgi:radical SAM-linked protein